jgi:hypothetical protein
MSQRAGVHVGLDGLAQNQSHMIVADVGNVCRDRHLHTSLSADDIRDNCDNPSARLISRPRIIEIRLIRWLTREWLVVALRPLNGVSW